MIVSDLPLMSTGLLLSWVFVRDWLRLYVCDILESPSTSGGVNAGRGPGTVSITAPIVCNGIPNQCTSWQCACSNPTGSTVDMRVTLFVMCQ